MSTKANFKIKKANRSRADGRRFIRSDEDWEYEKKEKCNIFNQNTNAFKCASRRVSKRS